MAKKTYLDYFLDNEEAKDRKKKKPREKKYRFGKEHEDAILLYNSGSLSADEANILWKNTIYPSLKTIVNGVLEMKKFHFLPRILDREILIEDTLMRLMEKLYKFTPGLIGKSGEPVKAFSYLSTIAKNFILEKIKRANKILENKADVESSIDLYVLSEDNLDRIDKPSYVFSVEEKFNQDIKELIRKIEGIIYSKHYSQEEEGFYKVGYTLIYIFKKWNKIEFEKKNEFMRLLTLYTGLKQSVVASIFKKYKEILHLEDFFEIRKDDPKKRKKVKKEEIDSEELIFEANENKYEHLSFEEYEIELQKVHNADYKKLKKRINSNEE